MKWALGVTLVAGIVVLSGSGALYGQVKLAKGTPIATMPAMEALRRVAPSPVVRPPSWNDVAQEFEARRRQRKEWGVGYEFVDGYYAKLARPESTGAKTLEEHLEHLARWRQEMPNSVAARLVTARALLDYAWEARGGGWAGTVTTEGWKLFDERVSDAQRLVDRAIALGAPDAEAYALLVKLGYAKGHPREQVQEWVEEGIKLDPTYYSIYTHMAVYLMPRWMGEPGDIEEFAADVAKKVPGDKGLEAFARIALEVHQYERGSGETLLRGGYDHKTLVRAAEVMLKRNPRSSVAAHFAALCAMVAQDHEAARRIRPYVGQFNAADRIWPWENSLRHFYQWSAAAEDPRGEERRLFAGLTGCTGIAFANNERIWVAQQFGASGANLMDLQNGEVILPLPHPGGVVNALAADAARDLVVVSSGREFTGWTLWDLNNILPVPHETKEQCRALAIHPQRPAVFWAEGMTVRSWDVKADEPGPEIELKEHVHWMNFSPDGSLLAVNTSVCDVEAGKVKYKLPIIEPKQPAKIVVRKILAIDEEKRAWATAVLVALRPPKTCLVRFSEDGTTWDTLLEDLGEDGAWLSPDRKLLARVPPLRNGEALSRIDIWNVATGKRVKQFPGHWNSIKEVVFSPDGSKLASVAMLADVVKIWPLDGLAD